MAEKLPNLDQPIAADKALATPPSSSEASADAAHSNSAVGDFARTLAYTAIQSPVTALSQILDKTTGTNVAPNINMIDRADEGSFAGAKWHAQQVAAGVGALVPFVACLAVTKNISTAVKAEGLALKYGAGSAAGIASVFRTGEMATAGLLQGAILEPNQNKDKFLHERFTQGITSGATMGAMHVFSNKFSGWTGASEAGATVINKSFTTGLAGAAGGMVGLGTHGLLTGESLSGADAAKSVYQAAFTGAALGAIGSSQMRLHQPKSPLTELENYVAHNQSQVTDFSFLERQKERTTAWRTPKLEPNPDDAVISPLERVEMIAFLHRDADPLFRKPETMNKFVEKIRGTRTDDWDIADQKDADVWQFANSLRQSMNAMPEEGSKQDGRDYSAMKRLYKKTQTKSDETFDELQNARDDYRARLEGAVNEFLVEQKLPPVKLAIGDSDFQSSAAYEHGQVTVRGSLLGRKETEGDLVNALYHELTHLHQEVLEINVVADRLGLPAKLSETEIQLVKDKFKKNHEMTDPKTAHVFELYVGDSHFERGDKLVDDVLRIRQDNPLTASERAHAERIHDASVLYSAETNQLKIGTNELQRKNLNIFLKDESNSFITSQFFDDMVNKPEQFQRDYGLDGNSPELRALEQEHRLNPLAKEVDLDAPDGIETYDKQAEYYAQLKERMAPVLAEQLKVLQAENALLTAAHSKQYYGQPLEKEAFPTGILSQHVYNAQEAVAS